MARDMINILMHPSLKQTALLIGIAALGSLMSAWFIQYVLGYAPCQLCYAQRWPYYLGVALGLAAWAAAHRGLDQPARMLIGLTGLVMLVGAGLAVYHSGVEWKFWPGPSACSAGVSLSGNINDLMSQVGTGRIVPCDQPPFRLLGFSPANANVLISLVFAAFCLHWVRAAHTTPR